jgi:L-ascorbate metabolism protein UlaG (beta-lactamase superfamily)
MAAQHCNPEEAVRIHRDLEAKRSIAVHWGTFQLTDEGRDAPPTALTATGISKSEFSVLDPGQTIYV